MGQGHLPARFSIWPFQRSELLAINGGRVAVLTRDELDRERVEVWQVAEEGGS